MAITHLLGKLPQVRSWILATLEQHQAQARPVSSYGFPRLHEFYSAETLDSTLVVEVPRVPVPPLAELRQPELAEFQGNEYDGITYLNTYFVRAGSAARESLHFHELVHVIQWHHPGLDRFLTAYVAGYMQGGSYRQNPLEIMAYDFQAQFDSNGRPGNIEPLVRQQVDQHIVPMLARPIDGESQAQ